MFMTGRLAFSTLALLLFGVPAAAQTGPDIPEPMVFDMIRPLTAKAGEIEVNTLAQRDLTGPRGELEWAPEVELAVADGLAVELELPLINSRVVQYKMGLQKRLGTFRGGRSVHGVQYLGLHDREEGGWTSTLLWLLGNRFGERWSTMTMLGVGDVTLREGNETGTIINHSTFYDLNPDTVLGLEMNRQNGQGAYWLLMPQVHRAIGKLGVQGGVGAEKARGERFRPRLGLRLIREL
ncbi:hypothetical protein [Sphingomonas sp. Leaf257]|jgi:hypothetical protein|uniref:hypothetical protein n=1 Tax=Sphingomonas sp. Leaf257 TaxID=1736309 RepID=UPI000AB07996|nr:hypothetical protein [Sphingomonas sp. Leaf257]